MQQFMYSSLLMDLMLGLLFVEFSFLFIKDRGFAYSFLPFFCAGAALILALRMVIVQATWEYLAASLVLALIAHLLELFRRLKDKEEPAHR